MNIYRVEVTKTIKTWIELEAESEDDACDNVSIGLSVREDGTLDARSDMKESVRAYGVDDTDEEITGVEEV